jgi:hypothetical protein
VSSRSTRDLEEFVCQSFHLLFGDEYLDMPLKLFMAFKGDIKRNYGNKEFVESSESQELRYLIL